MRINEVLTESMTFTAGVVTVKKGPDGQPQSVISTSDFSVEQDEQCPWCEGSGKERDYNTGAEYDCRRCDGQGTVRELSSRAPELSVSNVNGHMILQTLLGIADPDYDGVIQHKQLPELQRRLIKLKNQSLDKFTRPTTRSRGDMGVTGQDQNVTTIGRQGPTIYDMGVSEQQVERYIDRLLELIKFAMDRSREMNKPTVIIWG